MGNLRNTKQKQIIVNIINKFNTFFTAEDIYNSAIKVDRNIGIATVYRFLNDMRKKGLLKSYLCDRRNLYSKDKISHCHYICEKTGKIIHFDLDSLDFLKEIKKKIPGSINSIQLEIKGVCNECK